MRTLAVSLTLLPSVALLLASAPLAFDVVLLSAAHVLAVVAAHGVFGMAGIPFLALPVPMILGGLLVGALAGWGALAWPLAALVGGLVGLALVPTVLVSNRLAMAGSLLALALAFEAALDRLWPAADMLAPVDPVMAGVALALAGVVLIAAFRMQSSLLAGTLHLLRETPRASHASGIAPGPPLAVLLLLVGGLAGLAGAMLASGGQPLPGPGYGLVLAASVLIGGPGRLSGALLAALALWLLPEIAMLHVQTTLDPRLAMALLAALLVVLLRRRSAGASGFSGVRP